MSTRSSAETISKTPAEDAMRLKELLLDVSMSQSDFADRYGIGSQAQMWQFLNPETPKGRPLNLMAALGFSRGLSRKVGDFSPSLQSVIDKIALFASQNENQLSTREPAAPVYSFAAGTISKIVDILILLDEQGRQKVLEYTAERLVLQQSHAPNSTERTGT